MISFKRGEVLLETTTKILLFIVLAIILTKLPIIGIYFSIANTLIHEVGHQLASILTFGKAHKIQLFANAEGLAFSSHRFWIGRFITTLSGYVFSSCMAATFYFLISKGRYDVIIYILLAILGMSMLFWVRNWYGFIWVITFGAGFVWLLFHSNHSIIVSFVLLLTSIVFVKSISSAFEIMYLSFKTPAQAGDASSLAKITYIIPAQIWGIFFFAQSLYFGWIAMRNFFPL